MNSGLVLKLLMKNGPELQHQQTEGDFLVMVISFFLNLGIGDNSYKHCSLVGEIIFRTVMFFLYLFSLYLIYNSWSYSPLTLVLS